jgi:hypothetical protein
MKRNPNSIAGRIWVGAALLAAAVAPTQLRPEPPAGATAAFDSYIGGVEARLAREHAATNESSSGFMAPVDCSRLRQGQLIVEDLTPGGGKDVGGGLLHDWRGTGFAPGAKAADFERVMKDFGGYPQRFSPQVVRARVLTQQGDRYQVTMRVRQHHILTVVLDTTYDVTFSRADPRGANASRGYSTSRSTRVAEIDAPGTAHERALSPSEDHGFLWRMNTYWSYEERDGGLYMQVESVSLTRSVPVGLGWAIAPFIESIPRESLEFTLRSVRTALRR